MAQTFYDKLIIVFINPMNPTTNKETAETKSGSLFKITKKPVDFC